MLTSVARSEQAVSNYSEVLGRRCLYQPSGVVSRVSSHCEANGSQRSLNLTLDPAVWCLSTTWAGTACCLPASWGWNGIHEGVAAPENVCDLGVNNKFQNCAAYSSFGVGRTAALHGKGEVILLERPSRSPLGRLAGEMSETTLWEAIAPE